MTSINAIRFDGNSGALLCDEQRHWNPERMKAFVVDKIRPAVPPALTERYGLAASYGNTGTSTIGEELRFRIAARVESAFREEVERAGEPPERFLSMEDLARLVFEEQSALKERHIDQQLEGRFGFRTRDLCRGYYTRDGEKIEIANTEVSEAAETLVMWKDRKGEARPVFGNSGILAGYSREDGFRIFHFSMAEGFWSPVDAVFLALGSGLDAANMVLSPFASESIPEGSGSVDRVEGILNLISAVHAASRNNLGVGGYFNIILIDGKKKGASRIFREVHDHRSKLAQEIVWALEEGFLTPPAARRLIDGLLFGKLGFERGLKEFYGASRNEAKLRRFLRGYRT